MTDDEAVFTAVTALSSSIFRAGIAGEPLLLDAGEVALLGALLVRLNYELAQK